MTPDTRLERILFAIGLLAGVSPLWAAHEIPMVDLPQHLHLISVLHRLSDASTLYPELFARRPELTPYLGYYYAVSLLNWLLPLELANRVFLSAYVAGLPLSLAFLLKSLKRPAWPALLAIPFAYGDSFAWGFINYCAALPLTFLTCGFFVRAIEDVAHRLKWAVALAFTLIAVLLMHVQAFAYLGLALPFLLLTTPAAEGLSWKARLYALAGVVPGVILFILWVGVRVGAPAEIAPGQPWKSWGPMLSEQNLSWKTFDQNWHDLVPFTFKQLLDRAPLGGGQLASMLRDGSDAIGVALVFAVAAAALGIAVALRLMRAQERNYALAVAGGSLAAFYRSATTADTHEAVLLLLLGIGGLIAAVADEGPPSPPSWLPKQFHEWWPSLPVVALAIAFFVVPWFEVRCVIVALVLLCISRPGPEGLIARWRMPGLLVVGLIGLFALPFDIRGYMYYLNTRYVHLIAALAVCCVPVIADKRIARAMLGAAMIAAAYAGITLANGFSAFDKESQQLQALIPYAAQKPRVMGLIYNPGSAVMTHPVFLHSSTVVARARGGVTNFSFALTPHSPLMYRGVTPPTFPSEWDPRPMNWDTQGSWYDHFVVRGADPRQIFGSRLDSELVIAAQSGPFFLVRKK